MNLRKGQSFLEYTLLVAIALVGLLLAANSLFKGSLMSGFNSHFDSVQSRITGA